jgi:putative aldouronate transport system substrate-binding protein
MKVAMATHYYILDYDDNDVTRFLEDLTNVHVEWELLPEQETREKVNLLFAAGDNLPDVFLASGLLATDLISLGSARMIIPLQDLVEKDSYFIKKRYEAHPDAYNLARSADGNSYSLVDYTFNEANQVAVRFWINKTFLDRLGLKTPTTTDEYYEYLKAVKTRDPNGNGRADEVPLAGAVTGWNQNVTGFLMNAFALNEADTGSDRNARRRVYRRNDGIIDCSFNKPEWKDGLAYLHKLYAEGLMAPESLTQRMEDLRAMVENPPDLTVGSVSSGSLLEFTKLDGERKKDFQILAPLKGPGGLQRAYYDEYLPMRLGRFVITKDCKIPDIAIKWADYMYTPDFSTRNRYGVRDRDWIVPEGKPGVYGGPALYEESGLKWSTPTKAYWGVSGLQWGDFGSYMRTKSDDPYEIEYVLYNALKLYEPYRFMDGVPKNLPFTVQEARRYSELTNLIVDYVDQSMASFIVGRLDLNRDWGKYLSDLRTMGVDEWLGLIQTAYDRAWK